MNAAFVQWLRNHGGYVNPKINLFHTLKSGDRGVYAEQDIKEGEQLLLVPVQATLHLDVEDITNTGARVPATCRPQLASFLQQQQQQQQQQPPGQQQQRFSSFISTTLMLMAELSLSADSGYEPYFKTFPQGTDCLLNWTDEEKQLLTGTSLESSGRNIEDIFTSDILPHLKSAPEMFPESCLSYESFRHAADLVQTRAFHMKADNWLTGTSQESTDELYLIPAIDMLNHSTDPDQRNTSLALVRNEVEVTLDDGTKKSFKDFFSMKAECDIPAGTQILHTYGDLSDSQLLQTYGFIDAPPAAATAAAASSKKSKKHSKKGGGSSGAAAAAGVNAGFSNPHNYVVLPMSVLLDSVRVVAAAAHLWPAKQAQQLLAVKLSYLSRYGLLPADNPESSQLMITATTPLPEDLLNIVQVLMMTEDEFNQLQQADHDQPQQQQQQQQASGGAAAGSGDLAAVAAAADEPSAPSLNLGRDLLQGEFGELCATVILQAVGSCLKRLPADVSSGASLLAAVCPGSRAWMAAAVAAGEQQIWLQIKKEALIIMMEAAQGDEDEDEVDSEVDDELDSEDDDELDSEVDHEDDGKVDLSDRQPGDEDQLKAPPAKRQKGSKQQQQQQQPIKTQKAAGSKRSAAAAAEDEQQQHQHGSSHKHRRKTQQPSGSDKSPKKHKKPKKGVEQDDRAHFGDMTGPAEEDGSDKVGYSSDEEQAAAAAAGSGSSKQAPRQRHPTDNCEVHTYEVGGSGAVREVHGHMIGPDEADIIQSDDSDKVGYCDAGSSEEGKPAAAAAAGSKSSKSKRSRGNAQGTKAATRHTSSKKAKKGLGFKG